MEEFVIETEKLTKKYGNVTALKDLDLKVPKNSIFGFLGPNGAGKTTAMKLLLGLIRPSSGRGKIMGFDTAKEGLSARSKVGYLPQQPTFYREMNAREVLRFSVDFFASPPEEIIRERIKEAVHLVGLESKAHRPVKTFSGGERQRLGLAQAYIHQPDLLILDEPAAALDPLGRRDVLRIMEELRERSTIFYSTHILDDVQQVSDTVAILNRGELVVQGPIESLLSGSGKTVYTVHMKGDTTSLEKEMQNISWIESLEPENLPLDSADHGKADHVKNVQWLISVTDDDAAEKGLFRLLAEDNRAYVTHFGKRKFELEDVFMELVQEKKEGEEE